MITEVCSLPRKHAEFKCELLIFDRLKPQGQPQHLGLLLYHPFQALCITCYSAGDFSFHCEAEIGVEHDVGPVAPLLLIIRFTDA